MLVIFDFDNTLEEFAPHERAVEERILSALATKYALPHERLRDTWDAIKRAYVHPRARPHDYGRDVWLRDLFRFYHLPEPVETWVHVYWAGIESRVRAFPGALDVLRELREHHTVCILSDSDGERMIKDRRIERLGITPLVDHVFTSDAVGHNKPHPKAFLQVLAYYGVAAEDAVMIGDNPPVDHATAHDLGIATVWVRRGADATLRSRDFAYVDAIAETLAEVPEAVATFATRRAENTRLPPRRASVPILVR